MDRKQILERAIQKAIDGGWDAEGLGGAETWREDLTEVERQHVIQLMFFKEGLGDGFKLLIFNHDFAKALWGGWRDVVVRYEYNETVPVSKAAWQYHLQQMVIADDPIKYLGDNL